MLSWDNCRDLIETLWNVKRFKFFNVFKHYHDLIETLWNVKLFILRRYLLFLLGDLIETLWNVKEIAPFIFASACSDLIETLWNVKAAGFIPAGACHGFNRDIVECKVYSGRESRTCE